MKIELKDENGKLILVDLKKSIYYLTDDMESESNACFSSIDVAQCNEQINTQILNADGTDFSITDSDNDKNEITDIDVYIEASHSETKINSGFYSGDSMLRDAESYVLPFGKPMIKNHDSHSEPLGRIVEAQCTDSAFISGVKAMDVKVNITDKEAITKFMDGRYKTVSIGANPKTIICNHCGKHILKDNKFNFCGHWRGETYNDKECTWKLEDLEYTELSVVNKPADRNAQVYKIVVNKKSDKIKNSENEKELILDDLSTEILNHDKTIVADGNNNDDEIVDVTNNNISSEENTEENTDVDVVIDMLNEKIEKLSNNISELQNENEKLRNENIVYSIDNETLNSKVEDLTLKIKDLSTMYKKDLVSVISLDEEKTFAEIKELFNQYLKNRNINQENVNNEEEAISKLAMKPASNPGLVNNENENVIEESEVIDMKKVSITNSLNGVIKSLIR